MLVNKLVCVDIQTKEIPKYWPVFSLVPSGLAVSWAGKTAHQCTGRLQADCYHESSFYWK